MADTPNWEDSTPVNQAPAQAPEHSDVPSIEGSTPLDEKYGGTGQQILSSLEGAAQGVAGVFAPAAEIATGLTTPEAIRGRAEASPFTHGLSEAAGFGGSLLLPGLGEARLAKVVGNVGEHAASLLPEATTTLAKIAQSGVKTGAELAALQTNDELTKAITQDPNQSLGSAAINIGLSGVLGGAGGSVIGSVSPLWKKTLNKMGVEKLASDYMGETKFLNENPDLVQGAQQEVNDRIQSAKQLIRGGLKSDLVDKLTQDVIPEKVDAHVSEISKHLSDAPKALQVEPQFQDAVQDWSKKVNKEIDPITLEPIKTPGSSEVFKATENLKRQLQEFAEPLYDGSDISVKDRPFVNGSAKLATSLKESLEDSKIWGAAADAQKKYNKAISPLFDIQKEFLGKFASKEMGEKVADPTKINTYLNQADKSKAGLKTNYVRNYLDQTQKAADAINEAYHANGFEMPLEERLNPTPVLDHSLNTEPTAGVNLARWAKRGGAAAMGANATGHIAAEAVGGGLGFMVGHPLAGAWMGDKILKPLFSAIAKPLAEKAINSEAAKASSDYIGNVIKGQKLLSDAAQNIFKSGAEIIPKHLMPSVASRETLQKSLEYASTPNNAIQTGGNIGHYLPDHATAAAATSSSAVNLFQALKPVSVQQSPLDKPTPIDPVKKQQYNRALDIAQQPLMVLEHAKKGTLQPQDVQVIKTIFPGLYKKISGEVYKELINARAGGSQVPYKQRVSLSLLLGQPLDSTMTQPSMQTILMANAPKGNIPQQAGHKGVSKPTASSMEKVNKMYATPAQSRAATRSAGQS